MANKADKKFDPIDLDELVPVEAADQIELFKYRGTSYTIPATVGVGIGLQFMDKATDVGQDNASVWLLKRLMGQSAFDTLCSIPGLPMETFELIMNKAVEVTLGGMDKDPSGSGA